MKTTDKGCKNSQYNRNNFQLWKIKEQPEKGTKQGQKEKDSCEYNIPGEGVFGFHDDNDRVKLW